ncbi:uncharacterized protein TNCV_3460041 [Trichonephila clavipes]|nr:uncharacterized protein TNCV_3460041 [Trichonephila clavipes]
MVSSQFETTGFLCKESSTGRQSLVKILEETNVTGSAYLDAVQLWLFPELEESEPQITSFGSKMPLDKASFARPPRSPVLTPWKFIENCVYVPLLPDDLPGLRHRIEVAVARITSDTLSKVWEELAYRLDVCRVTNGAHIECLSSTAWLCGWDPFIQDGAPPHIANPMHLLLKGHFGNAGFIGHPFPTV